MGLIDLEITKNFKLPLYDLATLAAGFYIGYSEGKGINARPSVEYLTKYGPTAFAMVSTSITMKLGGSFAKALSKKIDEDIESDSENVKIGDKRLNELGPEEKEEALENIKNGRDLLKKRIKGRGYVHPVLRVGVRTSIETLIGYVAGKICGQLN